MRWIGVLLVVSLDLALTGGPEPGRTYRFAKSELGQVPAGWKAEQTGTGAGSVWKVVAAESAPSKTGFALAQTAASPKTLFNLCVLQADSYLDLELSVAFRARKGDLDQGGGLVWRYQDADNYYVARMNPLEDNYRCYKVVAGKRLQLATKEDLKVPVGEWHTLKVRQVGDRLTCYLDGKEVLAVTDPTFAAAGKVGLWTKADAQTEFDDFRVVPVKK